MSPPLTGSRKDVLKCLSKMTIVIHPANKFNPWLAADAICRLPFADSVDPDQPALRAI